MASPYPFPNLKFSQTRFRTVWKLPCELDFSRWTVFKREDFFLFMKKLFSLPWPHSRDHDFMKFDYALWQESSI
jgi:hypothetical protein